MKRHKGVLLAIVLSSAISGCVGSEPDPAVARQERIESRLEASFSSDQAACITNALDPAALVALDGGTDLETDSPEMTTYTDAVVECTADP